MTRRGALCALALGIGVACCSAFGIASAKEVACRVDKAAWQASSTYPGIDFGDADDRVRLLVFFDPKCPYCEDLWFRLYPIESLKKGIRWIPVAYFNSQSFDLAASILEAGDPQTALDTNFRPRDDSGSASVATPKPVVRKSTRDGINRNTALWARLGALTPLIAFKRTDGSERCIYGMPDEATLMTLTQEVAPSRLSAYDTNGAAR